MKQALINQTTMKQPKFISLFQALSKREVTALIRYLHAMLPDDSIPLKVFLYLMKGDLEGQLEKLLQEKVLKTIYTSSGTQKLSKALSNTFSDLQGHLEEFLCIQKLKKNPYLIEQLLLEALHEKKLEEFVNRAYAKTVNAFAGKVERDQEDYLHGMRLYEFHFYNSLTPKMDKNTGIEECMEYLDLFFVTNKFKLAAEMRNRENFIPGDYNIQGLEEAAIFLEKYQIENAPASTLFYLAYQLNEKDTQAFYQALKEGFYNFIEKLSATNKNILMGYLINYTARAIRRGESDILEESFDLHRFGVEQEIFISDGYFPHYKFANIVELGCQLGKFDWLKQFIADWQGHLQKRMQKSVLQICQAIILFEKGDYKAVLEELDGFQGKDVFLNIRLRALILRAHYELGDDERVYKNCNSFETYLRRWEITHKNLRDSCNNFIKMVRKLLQSDSKWEKANLLQKLEETDQIAFKAWLIEKINDL